MTPGAAALQPPRDGVAPRTDAVSASERPATERAGWLERHQRSFASLVSVLAVAALLQAGNIAGVPQRSAGEGGNVAQAWLVLRPDLGAVPVPSGSSPLAALQLAGYAGLTGAFDRYDLAVLAAREAMTVFALASVLLVWLLSRRLGGSVPAATAACLLFAVSPLAVQLHRSVFVDNLAVPWLLGAFVLATVRRSQLVAFAASASAYSVAVLSEGRCLLALPFLAWVMWRGADPRTRVYTLPVAGGIATLLIGATSAAFASAGDASAGRAGSTTPLDAALAPFVNGSGWPFSASSASVAVFSTWWHLGAVLLVCGACAAVLALFLRRLRPIAALVILLAVFLLLPQTLAAQYLIVALPFVAIVIAGVVEEATRRIRSRRRKLYPRWTERFLGAVAIVGAVVALGVAAPSTVTQLGGLLSADADRPIRDAQQWVRTNLPHGARLIVDDAVWVDLVRDGFGQGRLARYSGPTDAGADTQRPIAWRRYDYVVATDTMRNSPASLPGLRSAIADSQTVAAFGTGREAVQVRRIHAEGLEAAAQAEARLTAKRSDAGGQLLRNPAVTTTDAAGRLIAQGRVDARLLVLIGQLATMGPVAVHDVPVLAGERGEVRRTALLSTGTFTGDTAVRIAIDVLGDPFAPSEVRTRSDGLQITYSVGEPDVLP
ncbi:hypothetical protein WDJ51_10990 [Rathayibacter sp. YIM 133350]|uniref:hypothetical protein n=1 Tax=Rathayibacter sp. YIM 133350 TaxID=3131992 RepID=UPI00307CFD87